MQTPEIPQTSTNTYDPRGTNGATRFKGNVVRTGSVIALTTALAVGGSACSMEFDEDSSRYDTLSPVVEEHENVDPIIDPVPSNIRDDFELAVFQDTCGTKVTTEQVTTMYQRLFGVHEKTNLTLPGMQLRTEQVTGSFRASQEAQDFVPLPEVVDVVQVGPDGASELGGQISFDDLRADAVGDQKYSLETYKKVAVDYFAQFGVTALLDWESYDASDAKHDERISRIGALVTPVMREDPANNLSARTKILSVMSGFTRTPRPLLENHNLEVVAFGNIVSDTAEAYAMTDDHALIFNTSGQNYIDPTMIMYNSNTSSSVVPHEVYHQIDYDMCGPAMFASYSGQDADPAIQSLNGAFAYDPDHRDTINKAELVDGQYGTLSEGVMDDGTIVTSSGYGMINATEDKATAVGEVVLGQRTDDVASLLGNEEDTLVLREKMAYLLARLNTTNPETVRYYVNMFDALRVSKELRDAYEMHTAEIDSYIQNNPNDYQNTSEYKTLEAEARLYLDMRAGVDNLFVPPSPFLQKGGG